MIATTMGKAFAVAKLAERRELYRNEQLPDNAALPAGSPMYYRCIGCGAPIVMHEGWVSKPDTCSECTALIYLGWME